jgi:hypothetical protein
MAGLSLLLASAWRTSRRGSAARRGLRQSRQETAAVSRDRDDLIDQRETARAYAAGAVADGTRRGDSQPGPASQPGPDSEPGPDDSRQGRLHLFGRRFAPQQAATGPRERVNGEGVDVPSETPAP